MWFWDLRDGRWTYVREGDALVGDVVDLASGARDGLDADTVVRVDDLGVEDLHAIDGVVVAAADGANGETVATGAVATGEGDVSTAVDGKAVVLVVDGGARDGDAVGRANVESVGVVAAVGVTVLVVDGDIVDLELGGSVDGEDLNGRVLDGLREQISMSRSTRCFRSNLQCP